VLVDLFIIKIVNQAQLGLLSVVTVPTIQMAQQS